MKVIKFTKVRYIAFAIAVILIACGISYGVVVGPNWGIDFKHGLNMVITVQDYDSEAATFNPAVSSSDRLLIEEVRGWFSELAVKPKVQLQSEAASRYTIRLVFNEEQTQSGESSELAEAQFNYASNERAKLTTAIEKSGVKVVEASVFDQGLVSDYQGRLVVIESSQSSSPAWTANSWSQLIVLLLIVLLLITIYIWVRFAWRFAIAATLTLACDIGVMVAFIAVLPFEISKTTIAALLTIVGYSLNDTIVIFDRIRENVKGMADSPIRVIINTSITQSISRTAITSLTTLLAVVALFIFTEGDVKSFAANMAIGVIWGTFSSNFVAPGIFLDLSRMANAISKKRRDKKVGATPAKVVASKTEGVSVNENGEVELELIERKPRRKKSKR